MRWGFLLSVGKKIPRPGHSRLTTEPGALPEVHVL
jgi:hypothetical protein